jgi:hypothetical protein
MKSAFIQFFLALLGIFFAIGGQFAIAAPYIVGSFVIWALRGNGK